MIKSQGICNGIVGPDDLVIHKSIQLYDLSLEETIYRSDKKKKKKVERIYVA